MLALDNDRNTVAANGSASKLLEASTPCSFVGKPLHHYFLSSSVPSVRKDNDVGLVFPLHRINGEKRYGLYQKPIQPVRVPKKSETGLDAGDDSAICAARSYSLEELAGSDSRMANNARCAKRVVDKKIPIMLLGETGVGKEAFAQAIHKASQRSHKPFVAINCASIPEPLIESELFGYKHGAFTGARREGMQGKVVQACGGTLFLDEIGDMPVHLQTKLLRVLEEQAVVPLGCNKAVTVDLNVISATNKNIDEQVRNGDFRQDLYYRLNGVLLRIPPLKERTDLEQLILRMLEEESSRHRPVSLSTKVLECLLRYEWPGNVRQLRNTIRSAIALCDSSVVTLNDLPREIVTFNEHPPIAMPGVSQQRRIEEAIGSSLVNEVETAEKSALIKALEENRWNATKTAKSLCISRSSLYRKIKKFGIDIS